MDQETTDSGLGNAGRLRIGRYLLKRELGRGGQARVYLAVDEQLDREVALKVLEGGGLAQPMLLKRFQREAAIVSQLDDPGICSVYDAGVADGLAYIAMRYVRGQSFSVWLKERWAQATATQSESTSGSLSGSKQRRLLGSSASRNVLDEVLFTVETVARSLQVAHDAGVIHRDIKPANIMMTENNRPILVDFGLARAAEMQLETLTISGDLFGTPLYMSPEQVEGKTLDARSDVYSLGVVLFESVTGQRPFKAPTRDGLYRAILHEDAADIRSIHSGLPADLAIVVATALEKDIDRRYQSAADLASDLRRMRRNEVIRAKPVSAWFRFHRMCQRNPLVASLTALLFVVLAVGLTLTVFKNRELERQRLASEWAAYSAQVFAAQSANNSGDSIAMRAALDASARDRRGWEWDYLNERAEDQLASFRFGPMAKPHLQVVENDDRFVWIGGDAHQLRLIDTESLSIVRELESPIPYDLFAVAPQGDRIAVWQQFRSHDVHPHRLVLLDAKTGETIWQIDVKYAMATVGTFSPDGSKIVLSHIGTYTVYEAATGRILGEMDDHPASERWSGFLTNEIIIGSISKDGVDTVQFVLTDVVKKERVWTSAALGKVSHFDMDRKRGRVLIVSSEAGDTRADLTRPVRNSITSIFDFETKRMTLDRVQVPGSQILVGEDKIGCMVTGSISLHEQRTGVQESRQLGPTAESGKLCAADQGQRLVSVSGDGLCLIWASTLPASPWLATTRHGDVCAIDPGFNLTVAGSWGTVAVFDCDTGALRWELSLTLGDLGTITAVAFSPDSQSVAATDLAGSAYVIDVPGGKLKTRSIPKDVGRAEIKLLRWSRDGRDLFLVDARDRLQRLDCRENRRTVLAELDREVNDIVVADDGLILALGKLRDPEATEDKGAKGELIKISSRDGQVLERKSGSSAFTALSRATMPIEIEGSPQEVLLVGNELGHIAIQSLDDLEEIQEITNCKARVRSLSWSPDISRILVGATSGLTVVEPFLGQSLLSFKIPKIRFACHRPASNSIFFSQGVRDHPFGLFEIRQDKGRDEKRQLVLEAFRIVEAARASRMFLAYAQDDLATMQLSPKLREAVDDYLSLTIDSGAELNNGAWGRAANPRLSRQEHELALDLARRGVKAIPYDWGLRNSLSMALYRCELYEECLKNIDEGLAYYLELGAKSMHSHDRTMRALALYKLGRIKEAQLIFDELIEEERLALARGEQPNGDTRILLREARTLFQSSGE